MNVTYLFGAGASAQALPVVNGIPERIKNVISILDDVNLRLSVVDKYDTVPELTKLEIQLNLIEDLKWLLEKSENHASIDTFAKKLFIKNKYKELERLKAAFSIYLIIDQTLNPYDKRYDSFYASLLKDGIEFPNNLRILSWNYDFQFEKAFSEYTDNNEIYHNQHLLRITNKFFSRVNFHNETFCIYKLNGTSTIISSNEREHYFYFSNFENQITTQFLDNLLRNYAILCFSKRGLSSGLSFAWERYGDENKDIVNLAKNGTDKTEVLVVIGYSFPFFNREVDREIINNMTNLKKVYFQSPEAENIKERFLSIRSDISLDNLKARFDVGQFLIPDEM